MQVLKKEIRKAIIENAENEFLKYGYEKASIRTIAKKAGTTIGNFYNYFKSKEELFHTITTPIYEGFKYVIEHHNDEGSILSGEDLSLKYVILKEKLENILNKNNPFVYEGFSKGFIILIDGSKGTQYENVREEIIGFLAEHFKEHIKEHAVTNRHKYHPYFSHVLASSFLEGLLDILRANVSRTDIEKLVVDYIMVFFMGFLGTINES